MLSRAALCVAVAHSAVTMQKDAMAFFIDQSGLVIHPTNEQTSIKPVNVADVIIRSLGAMPAKPQQTQASFLQTSFFHRPRADLLLNLESMGQESLDSCGEHCPNLRAFGSAVPAVKETVQSLQLEVNELNSMASIATDLSESFNGVNLIVSLSGMFLNFCACR